MSQVRLCDASDLRVVFCWSLPGGRLEEAELVKSGFEGATVFGCVLDGSRMMLIFYVFAGFG